ncbi:uncharacterized protein LOC120358396 [Solenopsis invicta]|uniref:uncharacterized protein LOC120358396 n=1 Tax=Solenopsis invicta TaxID=13686 RepID=UPI00193E006A|nr:uncharacterized protein LOC120358396 [Solenopsis invicta]
MMSYPFTVTTICYFLYKGLRLGREGIPVYMRFSATFWLLICIGKVYILNYICENICAKANKIDKTVNELTNILRYADTWKEVKNILTARRK